MNLEHGYDKDRLIQVIADVLEEIHDSGDFLNPQEEAVEVAGAIWETFHEAQDNDTQEEDEA